MKICRVCGVEREDKDFYKIKHIYKFINYGKKVWCRDCQKLYVEMKKEEERKKKFDCIGFVFDVSFT